MIFSFIISILPPLINLNTSLLCGHQGALSSFGNLPFSLVLLLLSIEFLSKHNNAHWVLTNVYAPCSHLEKRNFIHWFKNIQMPVNIDWLIVVNFNLCHSPDDRNQPEGSQADMYLFNEAISYLGLIDIPLKGRKFTWSNKQQSPLLERLDWFFSSTSWTLSYPNTFAYPLSMETSDHIPCTISVSTKIPKGSLFRFENHWMEHPDFLNTVQQNWWAQPI